MARSTRGADVGHGASCATLTSLRAPPLRLAAGQNRSALWETASAAHRSPVPSRRPAPRRPADGHWQRRHWQRPQEAAPVPLRQRPLNQRPVLLPHGHLTSVAFFGFVRNVLRSDEAGLGRLGRHPHVRLEDTDTAEWGAVGDPPSEKLQAPAQAPNVADPFPERITRLSSNEPITDAFPQAPTRLTAAHPADRTNRPSPTGAPRRPIVEGPGPTGPHRAASYRGHRRPRGGNTK
jgi:hypothetical protein